MIPGTVIRRGFLIAAIGSLLPLSSSTSSRAEAETTTATETKPEKEKPQLKGPETLETSEEKANPAKMKMAETLSHPFFKGSHDNIEAKVIFEEKLNADFFKRFSAQYLAPLSQKEDGSVAGGDSGMGGIGSEDLRMVEHTADMTSTYQGEHRVRLSSALLMSDGLLLSIYSGNPAYFGKLKILIYKDNTYKCFFMANSFAIGPPLNWEVTKKELRIKKGELAPGQRLYGHLLLEFEETNLDNKVKETYRIEGLFKPVIQDQF